MATDKSSHNKHPEPAKKPEPPEPKPRHPAQPEPAEPGVAQGDQQPKPPPDTPPPPPEKVLSPDEARALFRAGHKLKRHGAPSEKWLQASRIGGVLVMCVPIDEDVERDVFSTDLVLADDLPTA